MTNPSAISFGMPKRNNPGRTAIFALTRKGAELASRLSAQLPESTCYCNSRYALPGMIEFGKLSEVFPSAWHEYKSIICVMSCGIAVRAIAPLAKDKLLDPAVVVLDQAGRFAISLLSGHIGGANELARKVASITSGRAVITTASDLEDKPAVDLLAKDAGLIIENKSMLGRVAAAILDEEPLWIFDSGRILLDRFPEDFPLRVVSAGEGGIASLYPGLMRPNPGIWVSEFLMPSGVMGLILRPASLVIGIGCNRGTSAGEIVEFVKRTLEEKNLSPIAIRNFTSIDIKSDEQGLLEAAAHFNRPIFFCSREQLENIPVPNPSKTVERHIGAKSVCEASALWSAGTTELLIPKRKSGNCTLAIARASCQ